MGQPYLSGHIGPSMCVLALCVGANILSSVCAGEHITKLQQEGTIEATNITQQYAVSPTGCCCLQGLHRATCSAGLLASLPSFPPLMKA